MKLGTLINQNVNYKFVQRASGKKNIVYAYNLLIVTIKLIHLLTLGAHAQRGLL